MCARREGDINRRCDACMFVRVASKILEVEYIDDLPSPYKKTVSKTSLERLDRLHERSFIYTLLHFLCEFFHCDISTNVNNAQWHG